MLLVAVPALLVSGAALAGFLGGLWWLFDLFSNFRPQYAVVGVLAGAVLLVGKWRRTGMIVLAVGLLNAALVGWLWVPNRDTADPQGDTLRVLSFNVYGRNDQRAAVFDYIQRLEPDVVFIHEATRRWVAAAEEAGLEYQIDDIDQGRITFGTLVMSPPGSRFESFGFGPAEPRAVEIQVEHEGETISLLGIHPLSPINSERAALRIAQLRWAGDWAAASSGPAVVVGDFNATPWSVGFRLLKSESGFLDSTRGFGLQPSWPMNRSPILRIQIDNLLHSDEVVVVDRFVGPSINSDHAPLVVDLALAG